jgi:hypothetical protein
MGLEYIHRALVGSSIVGDKLFEGTNLGLSQETGTITKDNDGLLFTSNNYAGWYLFAQSSGDVSKFKTFEELRGHRIKLEADIEWLNTARDDAQLIFSLGIYTYPDPSYGLRLRYRNIGSDVTNNFKTYITDSFISDYEGYPNGRVTSGLENYYFVYRIYLNSPSGGSCRVKRFNVYDLGVEE